MARGSLGCASVISSRGTSLTPGPRSMPSTGANHGGKLKRTVTAAQVLGSALQVTVGETSASAWEEVSCSVRLGRGGGAGTVVGVLWNGWCAVGRRNGEGTGLKGSARGGVIENERGGEGGGGGGVSFYRAVRQLKGPQVAEEPQGQKFRYYSEIYALHQHISCKIKTKII